MYKRKRVDPRAIGIFVIGAILLGVGGLIFYGPGGLLSKTESYVLHFDGSVKGLNIGSPVRFRGVKIGEVKDINVRVRPSDYDFRIPVIIEIATSRIEADGPQGMLQSLKKKNAIQALVEKGLRARLELNSLLTGQLFVNFDIFPDTPIELTGYPSAYPELPTIRSSLGEFTDTLKELPLRNLAEKLIRAADGFEKLITSPNLHEGLAQFDTTMLQLNSLLTSLNAQVVPLSQTLQDTLLQTQTTLAHFDNKIDPLGEDIHATRQALESALESFTATSEQARITLQSWNTLASDDSRMQQQLAQTLQEISKAARSVRYLTSELERDPQLLLRGRVDGERR